MKRILIAPLNWGLGHATRCIPLIQALEKMGVQPVLASDGASLDLLRTEFPHLTCVELPSYRIRYRTSNMTWNIAPQLPRILYAIRKEKWVTEKLVRQYNIQGIISDNRYGCFSRRANSLILTHQLRLQIPNRLIEWIVNRILRLALAKFDGVWVPDAAGEPNLTGRLSHDLAVHPNICFTGLLTRMQRYPQAPEYDVALVLSGPEPQRSILEDKLLDQAISLPQKFIFIQGKTRTRQHHYAADNVEVVSFLGSKDLNNVLLASDVLVCRSGYSSIMDLAVLGKKAILIPTPGQTEQEYLAERLSGMQMFLTQPQDQIDLDAGLEDVGRTTGIPEDLYAADAFMEPLQAWVNSLQ